jgi:prolipoprotein diacylglyceryl transferase
MDFASIPSPSAEWRALDIGAWIRSLGADWFGLNLAINAYALFILLGIGLAVVITNRRLTSRGVEPWLMIDLALWAVPLGILGGRLFHVITHPADYFYPGADFLRIFYVWEGGLAIFGALVGGGIGAYIATRIAGLRFWSFADALAPGLLVAQGVGRLGNYFNQELFGQPTDLPWGLEIDPGNRAIPVGLPVDTLFHPTFAYEMFWNFLGAMVLIALGKRLALQWGRVFALYLVWYGIGRFMLEMMRLDVAEVIFGLRSNQWASLFAVVLGLVLFVVQAKRHPGLEPSPYQPGREWEPPVALDSEERYWLDEMKQAEREDATPAKAATSSRAGTKKASS